MVKGTPSFGKKAGVKHIRCRRCGRPSYHLGQGYCSACGYGKTSKIRKYAWQNKNWQRKRVR